ncbi:MAG: helix-turn-helix domain-containing protein [Pseudomonadota bacterium]|nr:helix-turn-helix domain-containing protein [Pseudomonadota bacterium]
MAGQRKTRLDRADWLEAAIQSLAEGGISEVSIEKLAAGLGVTRGSFYHHFRDRADLLREMLGYWTQKWTLDIREDIRALGLDPRNTLLALIRAVRHRRGAQYDVVFRAWALHDPTARDVVEQVDETRLAYIRTLFEDMGFGPLDVENRARLCLYYEMAEPTMFAAQATELEDRLIVERHRLLTTDNPADSQPSQQDEEKR